MSAGWINVVDLWEMSTCGSFDAVRTSQIIKPIGPGVQDPRWVNFVKVEDAANQRNLTPMVSSP